jgi:hypothetical protein
VPELALDNDQRHGLMRHLDSVRMAELMGGEPTAHTRLGRVKRRLDGRDLVSARNRPTLSSHRAWSA